MSFLSCCGRKKIQLEDEEALLPDYEDDTVLQRRLHSKMHTYQMIRAIAKGYMPSTEQAIVNVRTLLSSEFFNIDNLELSVSSQRAVELCRQWLRELITIAKNKNERDQIQDFLWHLIRSRISVNSAKLIQKYDYNSTRNDSIAIYESFKVLGSILLENSHFRIFVGDVGLMLRQIFADSAASLSVVAEEASGKIRPNRNEMAQVGRSEPATDPPPTKDDLKEESKAVAQAVDASVSQVVDKASESAEKTLSGGAKHELFNQLKQAVTDLRKRQDYTNSVSILRILLQYYFDTYMRAAGDTLETTREELHTNRAVDLAINNLYLFLTSFGEGEEWRKLEMEAQKLSAHVHQDPEFEKLMQDVGDSIESMFTDPEFYNQAESRFGEIQNKTQQISSTQGSLPGDVRAFLHQIRQTLHSVILDVDVCKMLDISKRLLSVISPEGTTINQELWEDAFRVFVPHVVKAIQYIPLPRLEVSTPDVDILLENLVLEPGDTINHSSFLPFRVRVETQNNVEIRKARLRTSTEAESFITVKLDGLSVRADELGYWMRLHSGLARFTVKGLASFRLDQEGIDIHLDLELSKESPEQILTLRDVRVHIHHLDYSIQKSSFAWLAWVLKPIVKRILRKTLEKELAGAISSFLHAANRELLFARERLRATRIADPDSLSTFFKAVITRLTPKEDPDIYTSFGIFPSGNRIFRNRYTPGSLVKLWEQENYTAKMKIDDFERGGWRNDIFDVNYIGPA